MKTPYTDEDVEKELGAIKEKLPVNQELKHSLRQQWAHAHASANTARKNRFIRWGIAAALILCVGLTATFWQNKHSPPYVQAAALHVLESYTIMEQLGRENSDGMAEYEGTQYLPLADKGLFTYTSNEFKLLIEGDISYVRVSPDGKNLVYVDGKDLKLYNLLEHKSTTIVQATANEAFITPAWATDGKSIVFVKRSNDAETEPDRTPSGMIVSWQLRDGTVQELAVGANPSFLNKDNALLFERDGAIVLKDLASGTETKLDDGRSPAPAPNGYYVAYVKDRQEGKHLIPEVWIADHDFATKQQISNNTLADAWDRKSGKLIEGEQQPRYQFDQPVWSSDGEQLYVYKVFHTNVTWKKLMHFDVHASKATPEAIVARSIEALIYRDEDFAHSFFSYDPGYLKGTSPRQVGYRIVGNGEQNGEVYVDAETELSYYDPFFQLEKTRYWLEDRGGGYLIKAMEHLSDQTIDAFTTDLNRSIDDKERELVLPFADIPADEDSKWVNANIDSIVDRPDQDAIYFLLHRIANTDAASRGAKATDAAHKLTLMRYKTDSKQFEELTEFSVRDGEMIPGFEQNPAARPITSLMIIDEQSRYAAIEIDFGMEGDVLILDLANGQQTWLSKVIQSSEPVEDIRTRFWKDGKLIYFGHIVERDVFFTYDPQAGEDR